VETLDNILSRDGKAMPSTDTQEPTTVSTPTPETQVETGAQPDEPEVPETDVSGQRMVPKAALDEARNKAKRYTEQVAEFDRKLTETNAQWERRMAELMARLPQQQPQEQQSPDWYENPDAAARHAVQPQLSQLEQHFLHNSQLIAEQIYGDDTVKAAVHAFDQAMKSSTLDIADYHKVASSHNRFAEAVKWHKRQAALSEIGDDPSAYRQKVEAEILAKYGLTPESVTNGGPAPTNGGQPLRGPMPSNLAAVRSVGSRTGPQWGGPQSIDSIFSTRRAK
jgi:hypothetical protein